MDSRIANPKAACDCMNGQTFLFVKMSNSSHVIWGKFLVDHVISPLVASIRNIIQLASKKQMFWINARRIVAAMANIQTSRNVSTVDIPSESVGSDSSVLLSNVSESVSLPVFSSNPNPAGISFVNLILESLKCLGCSDLTKQSKRYSLWLHSKFVLLCRALGFARIAEAILFHTSTFGAP